MVIYVYVHAWLFNISWPTSCSLYVRITQVIAAWPTDSRSLALSLHTTIALGWLGLFLACSYSRFDVSIHTNQSPQTDAAHTQKTTLRNLSRLLSFLNALLSAVFRGESLVSANLIFTTALILQS